MVYQYKRKTARASWDEKDMELAMKEVNESEGALSIRGAAAKYNIPYPTLRKHILKGSGKKVLGRYRPVFTPELEEDLVQYLKRMECLFYGLTRSDLEDLAFELAERNGLKHNFKNKKAGEQWVKGFMKRHRELSFRSPETTSVARAQGFNRISVGRFFTLLRELLDKHKFDLADVYNVDETGIKTSASRPPKVVALKGKRQVGVICSAEKGQLITVLVCCSATGSYIPPAIIFPRKRLNPQLLDRAPPGTQGFVSDSGWVNGVVFLDWLHFFVSRVRSSKEHKVLLIVDNHESHRALSVIDYASENGVVLLSVPPHTTHKLQPLDLSVYGPFKTYFEQAVDTWQKNHPARRITQFEIAELFEKAYVRAATVQNAVQGFVKSGIRNCDISVFNDSDFAPAEVTERPNPGDADPNLATSPTHDHSPEQTTPGDKHSTTWGYRPSSPALSTNRETSAAEEMPETETLTSHHSPHSPHNNTMPVVLVSPEDIRPLPKKQREVLKRRQRQRQQAEVLTSTPFKATLKEKTMRQPRPAKQRLFGEKQSSSNDSKKKKMSDRPSRPKTSKNKASCSIASSKAYLTTGQKRGPTSITKNYYCLICNEQYLEPVQEDWIQCFSCKEWAHEGCTAYDGSGDYTCDNCIDD